MTISTTLRNQLADSFGDTFNSGTLEFRSGSAPGPNAAATGTLLASIALPADCFGASATGVIAKSGTWQDASVDASGTIGYGRMKDSGGTKVVEFTVTATSGQDMVISPSLDVVAGGTFTVNSLTITFPA